VRVVVGLGNPGSEYHGTRHNIGFAIVDAVAEKIGIEFDAGPGEYHIAGPGGGEHNFVLIKPLTYMNNSGIAVKQILEQFAIGAEDLLVVIDDFHLPLGSYRIRQRGSSGGHNGLYSIIYHLQSEDFPRLRFGIAGTTLPADKSRMADFVLAPFEPAEAEQVTEVSQRVVSRIIGLLDENRESSVT